MYVKENVVCARASHSYIPNNLASISLQAGYRLFASAHQGFVNVITTQESDWSVANQRNVQVFSSEQTQVLDLKWVEVAGRLLLVLCSDRGVQVYEADGSAMLYFHGLKLDGSKDNPTAGIFALFCRGVASYDDRLCVGTSFGYILTFIVPAKGSDFQQADMLKGHDTSISAMANCNSKMVSGDDFGKIIFWSGGSPLLSLKPTGFSVLSMSSYGDWLVTVGTNGQINVLQSSNGAELAAVHAHARLITALDVSADGFMLTTSDDSYARIWYISKAGGDTASPLINLVDSVHCLNQILVGGQIIAPKATKIAITSLESNDVQIFKLK